jgi:hypothetical protein
VRPVNNVVVTREPYRRPAKCGGFLPPSRIVLFDGDGRVIKAIANAPGAAVMHCCGC